jgi:DNA modification methylase
VLEWLKDTLCVKTVIKICIIQVKKKNHENHNLITHPTQKPIQLAEKLIFSRINGNKGRTLIPFAWSGSECVAA